MLVLRDLPVALESDLREKADIYAQAGVDEYWVIDIPNQRLHRMLQSDGKIYRKIEIVLPPQTPSPMCHPSATLNLAELFVVS